MASGKLALLDLVSVNVFKRLCHTHTSYLAPDTHLLHGRPMLNKMVANLILMVDLCSMSVGFHAMQISAQDPF